MFFKAEILSGVFLNVCKPSASVTARSKEFQRVIALYKKVRCPEADFKPGIFKLSFFLVLRSCTTERVIKRSLK